MNTETPQITTTPIVKVRKSRTNKRYKYIIKVKNGDTETFTKKYMTAGHINKDFKLLTKDKVSDILNKRYKGVKRSTKSFFNTITIERINELI